MLAESDRDPHRSLRAVRNPAAGFGRDQAPGLDPRLRGAAASAYPDTFSCEDWGGAGDSPAGCAGYQLSRRRLSACTTYGPVDLAPGRDAGPGPLRRRDGARLAENPRRAADGDPGR